MNNVLITGGAGFIGFHLAKRLFAEMNHGKVVCFDNMNDYYSVHLKNKRKTLLAELSQHSGVGYWFVKGDVANKETVSMLIKTFKPDVVVHLAAQAGVGYSVKNPESYLRSNVDGFWNVLNECAINNVPHFVYASSSSVYGDNDGVCVEDCKTDSPVSFYAATKKCNEVFAQTYSSLYNLPCTGIRFFTVYGPYGRPDMSYYKFSDILTSGGKVELYNNGNCKRCFTYVDDAVECIVRIMKNPPQTDVPHEIYNVCGKSFGVKLFFAILHKRLADIGLINDGNYEDFVNYVPLQTGDVDNILGNMDKFEKQFGKVELTPLIPGLEEFAKWYAGHYGCYK